MEENQDKEFKIFDDYEEGPEKDVLLLDDEVEQPEVRRSSARPVFIAVFAFCILGGLLFFGYYQLNNRISRIESTGTYEMKGLNQEIDERMTALGQQLKEQSDLVGKQIGEMGTKIDSLSRRIDNNASEIGSIKKLTASNAQSSEKRIANLETGLPEQIDRLEKQVSREIAGIGSKFDSLDKAVEKTGEMSRQTEQLRQSLNRVQERINSIAVRLDKIESSPKAFDDISNQMGTLEQELNKQLKASENQLQLKIDALGDEIGALEAMLKSIEALNTRDRTANGRPEIIEQEID